MPFLKKNKPQRQQPPKQGAADRCESDLITGARPENGENRAIAGHQGLKNGAHQHTEG